MRTTDVAIALTMVTIRPVSAQQVPTYDDRPKITVSGEAVVNVESNTIVVTFGVETWNTEMTAAKEENNEILRHALASIEEFGIPERNVQTDHLSIDPKYKDDYRKEGFIAYSCDPYSS